MASPMRVVNINAKFSLNSKSKLDMQKLIETQKDYKFDRKYNRFFFSFRKPQGTITLYSSGNGICLGTTNVQDTETLIRRLAARFRKWAKLNVTYCGFSVKNIAVALITGHQIDLDTFAKVNPEKVRFNPESFAGAIYKHELSITLTVFRNGKINVTGIKSIDDLALLDKGIRDLFDIYRLGSDSLTLMKEILNL